MSYCYICGSQINPNDQTTLRLCHHRFHLSCLQNHSLSSNRCPVMGCNNTILLTQTINIFEEWSSEAPAPIAEPPNSVVLFQQPPPFSPDLTLMRQYLSPSLFQNPALPPTGDVQSGTNIETRALLPPSQQQNIPPQRQLSIDSYTQSTSAVVYQQSQPSSTSGFGAGTSTRPPPTTHLSNAAGMGTPLVRPNRVCNPKQVYDLLCKTNRSDKNKVFPIILKYSVQQRLEVLSAYRLKYGNNLLEQLLLKLAKYPKELIKALMTQPAVYDVLELRQAMGLNLHTFIEIFANRSNAEITQIRTVYANIYRSDLVNDMVGETTGHLNNLIFALCNGGRDEYLKTNEARAQEEALQLFKAFSSEINQNDPTGFFMNIIFTQNYDQLRMLFTEYERIAGRTLEQTIAELYRGALCEGLLSLVKIIKNRSAYFAELLYFYVNQSSTSEHDLIRLLVSRSEIDLFDIIQEYERVYGRSLEEDISNNFFGPFRSGLLAVIKGSQFDD